MERSSLQPGDAPAPAKSSRSHISGLSLRERKDVLVVAIEEQKKHMEEFDNQAMAASMQGAQIVDQTAAPSADYALFQIMHKTLEKVYLLIF
jgi:hypothetical protein